MWYRINNPSNRNFGDSSPDSEALQNTCDEENEVNPHNHYQVVKSEERFFYYYPKSD